MSRVLTNKKCPKCQSKNITIIELWKGHSITFEQREDGTIERIGNLESGDPYKLEAECQSCNYRWRMKGMQITDIIKNHPL